MGIDACFILAAGLGTRMGKIGEVLPKPMWPIFGETLISATKNYWSSFGIKKFFANVHHGSEQIVPYLESLGITPVLERNLLGSGGAFHNLKYKHPELKKILSVNCDGFPITIERDALFDSMENTRTTLLSTSVLSGEKFNRLLVEKNKLTGIQKSFKEDGITYSGVGVINLEDLKSSSGPSSFFETVANYKNTDVVIDRGVFDRFLDFGTFRNFHESSFEIIIRKNNYTEIINKTNLKFTKLLDKKNLVYDGAGPLDTENSIIIKSGVSAPANSIVFGDIIQKLD